jgi:hypothetical protein
MGDELNAGTDIRYDLKLTLAEALTGLTTTLRYPRLVRCERCNGAGVIAPDGIFSKRTACPSCGGSGLISQDGVVKVRIPAGVDTGSRIRVPRQGNEAKDERVGDLYIVTHVTAHENFKRKGDNLHTQAHVSAAQLASGTVVIIQTLKDGVKRLRIPAGTKEGAVFRMRGFGVSSLRDPGRRGDLFVTIEQTEPGPVVGEEAAAAPARHTAAAAGEKHADEQRGADKSGPREEPAPGLRVFLCHSSGDKPAVRELYHRLRADGVIPWLDEEDLLPGEKWEKEIPKAVRSCDVVIVCVSQSSINKKGYLQKEIRYALDAADEQPEGMIFLIPLKLEECEIPEHLSGWQWVNFFEERGYERLMLALRKRARSL